MTKYDAALYALVIAVDVIRKLHMTAMQGMAVDEEIERSWQHYLKTDPDMQKIMAALKNGKGD